MKDKIAIHWFRKDLRLSDNPSINYLASFSEPVLFIFILNEESSNRYIGAAGKVWLHNSLEYLNKQISGNLVFFKGWPLEIFEKLIDRFDVRSVSWNRSYEPNDLESDIIIKKKLRQNVDNVKSFNGSLLWEPSEVLKNDSSPYKVFTPFYKKGCLNRPPPRQPVTKKVKKIFDSFKSNSLESLNLVPKKKWVSNIKNEWKIGEEYAQELMNSFFKYGLKDYKEGRNFPEKKNVSRLSPYIHWGQISPNTLWYNVQNLEKNNDSNENIETFKSELGWREFSYYLLYHFPQIINKNLQSKFDHFVWEENNEYFKLWKTGKTGYPIVDAGMRELWQTGYMHNRVRMIVGSFLVKNLLHHWKKGEEWFWDCLFDADLASNCSGWQWVAGTGADAAPYFRIFNPVTQAQKFDPTGNYILKYVPELKNLPLKYLYSPWELPDELCDQLNFKLGINYPIPLVDLKNSREKALNAFSSIKKK